MADGTSSKDKWLPFEGLIDTGKTSGYFMKTPDIENYYGSESFKAIGKTLEGFEAEGHIPEPPSGISKLSDEELDWKKTERLYERLKTGEYPDSPATKTFIKDYESYQKYLGAGLSSEPADPVKIPKLTKAEYRGAKVSYDRASADPDFAGRKVPFDELSVLKQMGYSPDEGLRQEAHDIEFGKHLLEDYQISRIEEVDQKISNIDTTERFNADEKIKTLQAERNKIQESLTETRTIHGQEELVVDPSDKKSGEKKIEKLNEQLRLEIKHFESFDEEAKKVESLKEQKSLMQTNKDLPPAGRVPRPQKPVGLGAKIGGWFFGGRKSAKGFVPSFAEPEAQKPLLPEATIKEMQKEFIVGSRELRRSGKLLLAVKNMISLTVGMKYENIRKNMGLLPRKHRFGNASA